MVALAGLFLNYLSSGASGKTSNTTFVVTATFYPSFSYTDLVYVADLGGSLTSITSATTSFTDAADPRYDIPSSDVVTTWQAEAGNPKVIDIYATVTFPEFGEYGYTVTLNGNDVVEDPGHTAVIVYETPVIVNPVNFTIPAGGQYSGRVATFTDLGVNQGLSGYTATFLPKEDGSITGIVPGPGNGYTVYGNVNSANLNPDGSHSVYVTVSDNYQAIGHLPWGTMEVSDGVAMTAAGQPQYSTSLLPQVIQVNSSEPTEQPLAVIDTTDPTITSVSQVSVSVGTASNQSMSVPLVTGTTLTQLSGGVTRIVINGVVSSAEAGAGPGPSAPLSITLGSERTLTTRVGVDESASAYIVNPVFVAAIAGQPVQNVQVATLAGPVNGSYTVTINWGDGDASVGQITALGGDEFSVSGSKPHPYAAAGSDTIIVTVNGPGTTPAPPAQSIATVSPASPTVSGLSAGSGPTTGDTTVIITGTSFSGATAVDFGTKPAISFVVNSATQITATSPPGSGMVDVTVVTPGGTSPVSTADQFTYVLPVNFMGTLGDDTFTFTVGGTWQTVVVTLGGGSPTTYQYPASEDTNITFDGLAGNDSVTFTGGPGDETADLYPDHGTLTGTGYSVSVTSVEQITANSGGGNDQATLHDGPQADTFVAYPTYATLSGPGVLLRASGFRSVIADATAGGQDMARLYDSSGDDTFTAYPTYATLATSGETPDPLTSYSNRANDFGYVMAYATKGGADTASFFDSPGNDTFTAYPTYATMTGSFLPAGDTVNRSYYNRAEGFGTYQGTSSAGGTTDLAKLYDFPTMGGNFVAGPTQATFSGGGGTYSTYSMQATGFRYLNAYSTGGTDTARLDDSAGTDTFVATPAYGVMYALAGTNNPAFANRAMGFATVNAFSTHGGDDSVRLYDSAGDDLFTATPTSAELKNDPATNPANYDITANTFRYVQAFSTAGGIDKATLTGTSGGDSFESHPSYAFLTNSAASQPFYNRANYFAQVVATEGTGNTAIARLYDGPGKETLQASPTSATLSGTGFSDQAQNFRYMYAYATTGGDEAYLTDSGGGDTFTGTPTYSVLTNGVSYTIRTNSFPKVTATSTGGNATANLYDSAGNDNSWDHLADAVLSDGTLDPTTGNLLAANTYYFRVSGYSSAADKVNVFGTAGGTNTRKIMRPVDYALAFSGTWLGDPWP
jgi:hypothetical protein